jgi:hypothetical protein
MDSEYDGQWHIACYGTPQNFMSEDVLPLAHEAGFPEY